MPEGRGLRSRLFNGERVSQITGLQGKELGGLMRAFKESFESPEAQRAFLLASSPELIKQRLLGVEFETPTPRNA